MKKTIASSQRFGGKKGVNPNSVLGFAGKQKFGTAYTKLVNKLKKNK